MQPRDATHHSLAEGSEQHPHLPAIPLVCGPRHQPRSLATRHQCNDAMRDHVQPLCELAQERPAFGCPRICRNSWYWRPVIPSDLAASSLKRRNCRNWKSEFGERHIVGLFQAIRRAIASGGDAP